MLKISVIETDQKDCFNSRGEKIPCAGTGQDGELIIGTKWPRLRFADHGETVTDQLTNLTWNKDANLPEFPLMWQEAQDQLAESDGTVSSNLIRLYKALGGGWKVLPDDMDQNERNKRQS